ncbi:Mucolipin-3, partial [Lonchura striata]
MIKCPETKHGSVTVVEVVAFVPTQLILFRLSNQLVVAFKEDNMVAFKHLFPKGYKDGTNDTQAIYTHGSFLEHLAFVLKKYLSVLHETFGCHIYAWGHGDVSGTLRCFGVMAILGVPVVPNDTLGHYAYGGTEGGTRLQLCQHFFCRVDINPSNNTFDINPSIITGGDTWSL